MNITVSTSPSDILKGKFYETIATIEGYVKESRGDISIGTTYRAQAVNSRIENIKTAFLRDLERLAREINITPSSGGGQMLG